MDELSAGVAAAHTYIDPHIETLPWWQKPAAQAFITDERLRELVAAILDATHQVQQDAVNASMQMPKPTGEYNV